MTTTMQEIIAEVGYNDEWLALGIVGEPYLRTQYAEYQGAEDKHQEHYRCRAFLDFLARKPELTNGEIMRIFALTDEQMGVLEDHPEIGQPPVQKQYRRTCILRQLGREGLTDDSFRQVSESQDTELHKHALERDDLRRSQVAWLAEHGGSKAVRNQARELLRSGRFRA